MTKKEIKNRIDKLKKTINYHRYLYHVLDKQEISDAAHDSLKHELFELEQKYPEFITADSPTQRIGGEPLKEFKKAKHPKRMISLEDAFGEVDMLSWLARISKLLTEQEKNKLDFYCELKIDGLAIELTYENGMLVVGSTRGDGLMGEDVTQNLKTIEAIPLKIENNNKLVVRGEVFIPKKAFESQNKILKEKGLSPYANPRNIAAGSVRQLDPKITASRKLDSYTYDIITDLDINTHEEVHKTLKKFGFKTNDKNKYCATIHEVFNYYRHIELIREKLDYEIDGIVVIINNNKIFERLGIVGKSPRGAIAFKFAQNQSTTQVQDIKIQVGRTGAMTPVAILKPVLISGITITRATLHNEDEINRLGLKIGDTVIVGRAGDVIPDIIKVLPELRTGKEKGFTMPKICPSCKTKLQKSDTENLLRCPNPKCFARKRRNFYHFVSRGAFNIDGLGPKIIDRLLDEGLIEDPSDLFSLKEGDLATLERFGEKSAKNIIDSIRDKKEISLSKFIYALGIRNVGEETAIDLAKQFGTIEKLKNAQLNQIESVLNIGPVVAKSIFEWFGDMDNIKFLDKLEKEGVNIRSEKQENKGKLSGKTFVFTGTLESIDRNLAKEKVRQLGGSISESVSQNVDFVVIGDKPGSKEKKAKELGVRIIDEPTFLSLINQ